MSKGMFGAKLPLPSDGEVFKFRLRYFKFVSVGPQQNLELLHAALKAKGGKIG